MIPFAFNTFAIAVREVSSVDRPALIAKLRATCEELASFLRSVAPDDWERDFDVRHGDEVLTVRGTVDELVADYLVHEKQLRHWSE